MKKTILTATILVMNFAIMTPSFASGSLSLFCKRSEGKECSERVAAALEKMGCAPITDTLKCQPADDLEPNRDLCEVETLNCTEPRADLFITTKCFEGEKVSLRRFDQGLSLTWWIGFGDYLQDVCKR